MRVPIYSSDTTEPVSDAIPTQCFFGINHAIDHKSEAQLRGWQDLMYRMYKFYNESPLGRQKPLNPLEFAHLMTGMITDHAEDQKKLVRLLEAWKASCECEMCGQEALLSTALADIVSLLWEETEQNLAEVGGLAVWEALSADDREKWELAAYHRVCLKLGDECLNELTPEERCYTALFLWAGLL